MTVRLEEQIRRYTQLVDDRAAPLEDLVPTTTPEGAVIRAPEVEVTIPLRQPRTRRTPNWVYGVAAAIAVIVLTLPIWLSQSKAPDVANTTMPPPATTTPPVFSRGPDAFVSVDIAGQPTTNGGGWTPGVPIRVSVDESPFETLGETDAQGSFNFPLPHDVSARKEVTVEVGGVPTMSVVPMMTVSEMDEIGDRVLGRTDLPVEASCCVAVFLFTSPTDNQAEEFGVTIHDDGSWEVDLSGRFDVTNFTGVDVVYGDPNGLWLAWPGIRP